MPYNERAQAADQEFCGTSCSAGWVQWLALLRVVLFVP